MNTTPEHETRLHEALTAALEVAGIRSEFWHTSGGYTCLKVPVGRAEICLTDINGHVSRPLSDYSGLAVYYYPFFEHQGIRLYESPDLGIRRDPTLFEREASAAIKAIQLCRQLCQTRRGLAEEDRRLRLAPPQPTETLARFHRDATGRTTLTVATNFRLTAEEIRATLACHFEVPWEESDDLPEITLPELLDILATHAQPCVHGFCAPLSRFATSNSSPTRQWAAEQVRSLLPSLSWEE
ncbi:hypothetical protein ABT093_19845 [Kitasatospora sp. NPDC002551]|uniref:hypothetical protein n=1 Tax=Kitasatospora sp. NPDC002551 TaxID=3154539 RepID=UPI00331EC29F